jgi:hypothetical protein
LFWAKNANIFAKLFGGNIFKIITSAPGLGKIIWKFASRGKCPELNLIKAEFGFCLKYFCKISDLRLVTSLLRYFCYLWLRVCVPN